MPSRSPASIHSTASVWDHFSSFPYRTTPRPTKGPALLFPGNGKIRKCLIFIRFSIHCSRCSPLIVKPHHRPTRQSPVSRDEPHTREQLPRIRLSLCHNHWGRLPTRGLVQKALVLQQLNKSLCGREDGRKPGDVGGGTIFFLLSFCQGLLDSSSSVYPLRQLSPCCCNGLTRHCGKRCGKLTAAALAPHPALPATFQAVGMLDFI